MQAIILAAGKGERMLPLTDTVPKTMLPVAGKPILGWILDDLWHWGIRSEGIVVVAGYAGSEIKKYLKHMDIKIAFQEVLGGTGMALHLAKKYVDDDFLMVNGDTVLGSGVLRKAIQSVDSTVCVHGPCDTSGYAFVDVKDNSVLSLKEKRGGIGYASTGVYKLDKTVFDFLEVGNKYSLIYAINSMIQSGHHFKTIDVRGDDWLDFTYPWDLLRGNECLLKREGMSNYIGDNCDISPSAEIEPYTCIMDNVKIGHCTQIKNSIIMSGTKIPHLSYVGDSIIGRNCNFGAGSKTANLRFDGENIKVRVGGKHIDTGRRKLGAIMGHNVKMGVNSTILEGRTIPSDSVIYPNEVWR